MRAVALDDSVGHLKIVFPHRDGQLGLVFMMEGEHGAEVNLRQNVSVENEHRLVGFLEAAQRARRAQRLVFVYILNLKAEFFSGAKMLLDDFRLVVRGHLHFTDARILQLVYNQLENGLVAHRQHRLRNLFCQRQQPFAESTRHDHRLERKFVTFHQILHQDDINDVSALIEQGDLPDATLVHDVRQFAGWRPDRRGDRFRIERLVPLIEQLLHRGFEAGAGKNRAPHVTVRDGADQPAPFIDDQRKARIFVDAFQRLANGRVGRDEILFQRQLHWVSKIQGWTRGFSL